MKPLNYFKFIAIFMAVLIIMLPITLAEEFNRVYDANGNLVSDGKYYREYNGLNRLIKVRLGNTSTSPVLEEYLWHPIEERIVVKRVFYNGVYNYTVYYPSKEFVRIVNSSGTFDEKYIYQDGVLVAQIDTDGNKQFIHADHEGSNTLITDINGNVVENTFYSPYGEIISGGKASRFDYEGKEYDSLTEDYDFGFRKFDLSVPIPNQPDTLIQNVYDPQSLNRFAFERNNPYGSVDPDGHLTVLVPIYMLAIAMVAAVQRIGTAIATSPLTTQAISFVIQQIPNVVRNRAAIFLATTDFFEPYEPNAFKYGTDPKSVPYSQRTIVPIFENSNPSNIENIEGTQIQVKIQTPENTDSCEFYKLNNCKQETKTEDSKLKDGIIEDKKSELIPNKEDKKEEKNTAGSGSATGGGSGGCHVPAYCNKPGGSQSVFCHMC